MSNISWLITAILLTSLVAILSLGPTEATVSKKYLIAQCYMNNSNAGIFVTLNPKIAHQHSKDFTCPDKNLTN
jgi:hypothetical protein